MLRVSESRREMVDLPTPEGPQRTTSWPWGVGINGFGLGVGSRAYQLFDVLDLFLQAIDGAFDFDDVPRNFGVVGFAGDGVGFAEHFLGNKIELTAGVLAGSATLLEGIEMGCEALDFLADVGPLGEDG